MTSAKQSFCLSLPFIFQLKDKISEDDKKKVEEKCNEVIRWLDSNHTAEKEEFEHQQKELESVCNPIITKMYQGAGSMPGGKILY